MQWKTSTAVHWIGLEARAGRIQERSTYEYYMFVILFYTQYVQLIQRTDFVYKKS